MALLDNNIDILPLSSIAELLSAKVRTLKIYEEKGLLPKKESAKKQYSINDIKLIAFTHYLASVKKINANGILYILDMFHKNMDDSHKNEFLEILETKMASISSQDVEEIDF
ncbi:putative transcriptional regulator, MerR family [Sulfurimonas gotlandica GD1]|uniref:Putative transcriptional regulator, MerR family n=1 Tax=Sulfurimonas gotlandica (strain DSM 19862 / JCM 16533 / GD1) TaxID=929558 RepID=B6BHG8_SULGG|nr:MerR family transcriptional regulator [Sulfurimonas gotlandica]EDZ63236.1 conserved hypothetical protein [Sulfurimonas gotlandica GD1]EHP29965.1 putative transcriptional regulator, MerR family [Sulfurimonas gotlandica GD1]